LRDRHDEINQVEMSPHNFDQFFHSFSLTTRGGQEDRDHGLLPRPPGEFFDHLPKPREDVHANFAVEIHDVRVEPLFKIGFSIADHFENDIVVNGHFVPNDSGGARLAFTYSSVIVTWVKKRSLADWAATILHPCAGK